MIKFLKQDLMIYSIKWVAMIKENTHRILIIVQGRWNN